MAQPYFSEREGYIPATSEIIGPRFWLGYLEYIQSILEQGLLLEEFPIKCQDGRGIWETDYERLETRLYVEIEMPWPLEPDPVPDLHKVMDTVEFLGRYVSEPKTKSDHSYWSHVDYSDFNKIDGVQLYSDRVNGLFRRCGHPYELIDGRVERHGPDVLHQPLNVSIFNTGDSELDNLLEAARSRFFDSDSSIRTDSLEKLWDAWERLKTLENPDKRRGISLLLTRSVPCDSLREEIEKEARQLTNIGNTFRIRHHEVGTVELQDDYDVDYLFYRLFGLIWRLLKGTNRVR